MESGFCLCMKTAILILTSSHACQVHSMQADMVVQRVAVCNGATSVRDLAAQHRCQRFVYTSDRNIVSLQQTFG